MTDPELLAFWNRLDALSLEELVATQLEIDRRLDNALDETKENERRVLQKRAKERVASLN